MDAATVSAYISGAVLIAMIVLFVLVERVHGLVNSAMTKMKRRVEILEKEVERRGGPKAPDRESDPL